jgi:hypothetical protein
MRQRTNGTLLYQVGHPAHNWGVGQQEGGKVVCGSASGRDCERWTVDEILRCAQEDHRPVNACQFERCLRQGSASCNGRLIGGRSVWHLVSGDGNGGVPQLSLARLLTPIVVPETFWLPQ